MGQRAPSGAGRVCGIYTMGIRDPYSGEQGAARSDHPLLTASIGEDYADCQWPLTVKANR